MSMPSQESRRVGRIVPFRRERLQVRLSEEEQQRLAARRRAQGRSSPGRRGGLLN